MSCANSIEEAVALAERRWPGYEFKIQGKEAHGPCPICGRATKDGFVIFATGYAFCRPGDHHLWLDEGQERKLTEEETRLLRIESELRRQAKEQEDIKSRLSALEVMAQCRDHITYHKTLSPGDREWWYSQGINDYSVDEYGLGVCYACPTDREHRPSYTIPVFDSKWAQLLNIRHRIQHANGGDKYRPHMSGLGLHLFNSRWVHQHGDILLVEGEKKAIVVSQEVLPAMGIAGKNGFNFSWLKHFDKVRRLYIALDPDAFEHGRSLGREIKKRAGRIDVRVCNFPVKPDDLFTPLGGTRKQFMRFLDYAWQI